MKPLLLTLALVTAALAPAQSLRAQIEAANARQTRLMRAKDVAGLEREWRSTMAPDFKYVENGRPTDLKQMVAGMKMGLGSMRSLSKIEAKLLSLKESGSTATATTRHTMVGTTVGQDKKPHTMTFVGTSTDTYVKQGGKWKLAKMEWRAQSMAMDGKPMPSGG